MLGPSAHIACRGLAGARFGFQVVPGVAVLSPGAHHGLRRPEKPKTLKTLRPYKPENPETLQPLVPSAGLGFRV